MKVAAILLLAIAMANQETTAMRKQVASPAMQREDDCNPSSPCGKESASSNLVVVDTDFGAWMDDPFALAAIWQDSQEDLALVVSQGHMDAALLAAQFVLDASRPGDSIPAVAAGEAGASLHPDPPVLSGFLNESRRMELVDLVHLDGVGMAARVVRDAAKDHRQVTWICIGSFVNLGAFVRRFPELAIHVNVHVMAGSSRPGIHLPWGKHCCITPIAELNIKADVQAAQATEMAEWAGEIGFAPIESTYRSHMRNEAYESLWAAAYPQPHKEKCRGMMEARMSLAGDPAYDQVFGRHKYTIDRGLCGDGDPLSMALLEMYLAWLNESIKAGPKMPPWGEASGIVSGQEWRQSSPGLFDLFAYAQHRHPQLFDVRRSRLSITSEGYTLLNSTEPGRRRNRVQWGWGCDHPAAVWKALLTILFPTVMGVAGDAATGPSSAVSQ